jgi:predicted TIM-barrel fold metal-dependent hydrolase
LGARKTAEQIRARLDHPIIDGDGHYLELGPAFLDYVRALGGHEAAAQFDETTGIPVESLHRTHRAGSELAPRTALVRRPARPWWVEPSNSLDWATAMSAELLYRRLDQLGMDFVVLFPTIGIALLHAWTAEIRQLGCRAFNEYAADRFCHHADRMASVAAIPMHTPGEALAEIDHARSLGLKCALVPSYVQRPMPDLLDRYPELARDVTWLDSYGTDSAHDYDPVWNRCVELRLPLVAHSQGMGWADRCSPTSFSFNHMGHFAASGELLCKSLFLGGVTRRFPSLRLGLMEGGVSTACRVYSDLVSHWSRRGRPALEHLAPRNLEIDRISQLLERHGDAQTRSRIEEVARILSLRRGVEPAGDDFERAGIRTVEDIRDRFVPNFFFGAEADDPLTPWAFRGDLNPAGAELGVFFGSDIGHWDVRDMTEPVAEAWEQLETGRLSEPQFRAFCCGNALRLYGSNPEFFCGTVIDRGIAPAT